MKNRALAALVAFGAFAASILRPGQASASAPAVVRTDNATTYEPAQQAPEPSLWDFSSQALGVDLSPAQLPVQAPSQGDANIAAALMMIRVAEGTAKEGGYGALFGWPKAGRSFDPYSVSDHPKQFFAYTDLSGTTVQTSPAGAFQINWTTWNDGRAKFKAWAGQNGRSTAGFTPATQEAFATWLMYRDGVLGQVRAGRISDALPVLARRWASLPGYSQDNNPERTLAFVKNAYTGAGGVWA